MVSFQHLDIIFCGLSYKQRTRNKIGIFKHAMTILDCELKIYPPKRKKANRHYIHNSYLSELYNNYCFQ